MLQPGRHFGFQQEPRPAVLSRQVFLQQLLEGDFSVQLHVESNRDLADSPLGVRTHQNIPLVAVDVVTIRPVGGQLAIHRRSRFGGELAQLGKTIPGGAGQFARFGRGLGPFLPVLLVEPALPGLALADHRFEEIAILRGNRQPLGQDLTERLLPVQEPDPHRLEQIVRAYEVHLHRQDAEQQVRVALVRLHQGSPQFDPRARNLSFGFAQARTTHRTRAGNGRKPSPAGASTHRRPSFRQNL